MIRVVIDLEWAAEMNLTDDFYKKLLDNLDDGVDCMDVDRRITY